MVSQPSQHEAEEGPQRSVLQQKTLKYDSKPFQLYCRVPFDFLQGQASQSSGIQQF
jgi:hypothetical protein